MADQKANFDSRLGDYVDVPARIAEFRAKFPDGSLQPADLSRPYRVETIGDRTFIVVVAAAYRTPGDERPGIGMAYEQFPGRTPYTKDSELQNAETSAWGRAIVAALAADAKKGIATAEEIRNRQAERDLPPEPDPEPVTQAQHKRMAVLWRELGFGGEANRDNRLRITAKIIGMEELVTSAALSAEQAGRVIAALEERKRATDEAAKEARA